MIEIMCRDGQVLNYLQEFPEFNMEHIAELRTQESLKKICTPVTEEIPLDEAIELFLKTHHALREEDVNASESCESDSGKMKQPTESLEAPQKAA